MMDNEAHNTRTIPAGLLASMGDGHIGYIRPMSSDAVMQLFPNAPPMAPGLKLWALLAADGTPIVLTDSREAAEASAVENELQTVAVH